MIGQNEPDEIVTDYLTDGYESHDDVTHFRSRDQEEIADLDVSISTQYNLPPRLEHNQYLTNTTDHIWSIQNPPHNTHTNFVTSQHFGDVISDVTSPLKQSSSSDFTSVSQQNAKPPTPEIYLNNEGLKEHDLKLQKSAKILENTYERIDRFVRRLEEREQNELQVRRNFLLGSHSSGLGSSHSDMTELADHRNINLSKRYQDLVQRQLMKKRSVDDLLSSSSGTTFTGASGDGLPHFSGGLEATSAGQLNTFNTHNQNPLGAHDFMYTSMPSLNDSLPTQSARKRFPAPKFSSSKQLKHESGRGRPPVSKPYQQPRSAKPYMPYSNSGDLLKVRIINLSKFLIRDYAQRIIRIMVSTPHPKDPHPNYHANLNVMRSLSRL